MFELENRATIWFERAEFAPLFVRDQPVRDKSGACYSGWMRWTSAGRCQLDGRLVSILKGGWRVEDSLFGMCADQFCDQRLDHSDWAD